MGTRSEKHTRRTSSTACFAAGSTLTTCVTTVSGRRLREHTRSMATNKHEELNAKRSQLATVQQHLDEKTRDTNSLQQSFQDIQANKVKQEERGKKMEAEIRKIGNEL